MDDCHRRAVTAQAVAVHDLFCVFRDADLGRIVALQLVVNVDHAASSLLDEVRRHAVVRQVAVHALALPVRRFHERRLLHLHRMALSAKCGRAGKRQPRRSADRKHHACGEATDDALQRVFLEKFFCVQSPSLLSLRHRIFLFHEQRLPSRSWKDAAQGANREGRPFLSPQKILPSLSSLRRAMCRQRQMPH